MKLLASADAHLQQLLKLLFCYYTVHLQKNNPVLPSDRCDRHVNIPLRVLLSCNVKNKLLVNPSHRAACWQIPHRDPCDRKGGGSCVQGSASRRCLGLEDVNEYLYPSFRKFL